MPVKTVKYADPRIVLPETPTFGVPITAKAINNYRLPASALSDTSISFNNLVTLGMNQMYSNSFQIETKFVISMTTAGGCPGTRLCPDLAGGWVARPFPLASVTDQVRVNINGTVLSNQPAYTLSARGQYMSQEQLQESYQNECACVFGKNHQETGLANTARGISPDTTNRVLTEIFPGRSLFISRSVESPPSQSGTSLTYMPNDATVHPIYKKYHLRNFAVDDIKSAIPPSSSNAEVTQVTFEYTSREPIFCSPFATRLDANYASGIMGVQSLDISLTLNDLRRAFLMYLPYVEPSSYKVTIKECNLLYDVISVIESPTTAMVGPTYYPYRTIEPYITDYPANPLPLSNDVFSGSITSGVYTLTKVPTAIWVWVGPTKGTMQHFQPQTGVGASDLVSAEQDYFAAIDHINITMGNTTQILNNATKLDLYRTAKANGCQLTYMDFNPPNAIPCQLYTAAYSASEWSRTENILLETPGPGSVLRLIPGLDLIMNDRDLIPGSACENIVFQITVDFRWLLNTTTPNVFNRNIALWIGFEYAGILELSGGGATLNTAPLSAADVAAAPMISVTSENIPSRAFVAEGGGLFDKIWSGIKSGVNWLRKNKVISNIARAIPHPVAQTVGNVAGSMGFGYPIERVGKRMRSDEDDEEIMGGAIMGLGDFC